MFSYLRVDSNNYENSVHYLAYIGRSCSVGVSTQEGTPGKVILQGAMDPFQSIWFDIGGMKEVDGNILLTSVPLVGFSSIRIVPQDDTVCNWYVNEYNQKDYILNV